MLLSLYIIYNKGKQIKSISIKLPGRMILEDFSELGIVMESNHIWNHD